MEIGRVLIDKNNIYKEGDIISFRLKGKRGSFIGRLSHIDYEYDSVQIDCSDKYNSIVINCQVAEMENIYKM